LRDSLSKEDLDVELWMTVDFVHGVRRRVPKETTLCREVVVVGERSMRREVGIQEERSLGEE